MSPIEWFYSQENKQIGPVSAVEMKRLAATGKLTPSSLVWREGMEEWVPAGKVKGLFDEEIPAPHGPSAAEAGRPGFEESAARFQRSREGTSQHLFDFLLDFARSQFTPHFVDSAEKVFSICGHYCLYVAMTISLVFSLILAIETNDPNKILLGVVVVILLATLQYAAGRFSGALARLSRTTPAAISSTAFPDCLAVFSTITGLVVLLALAVLAIQLDSYLLILPAVAQFIICQHVAILALNPEALDLDVNSELPAGEELIGVSSFFMKVLLRAVPVVFGVGVTWGTFKLAYALFLMFLPPAAIGELGAASAPQGVGESAAQAAAAFEQLERLAPARLAAADAQAMLVSFAALPLLVYVVFLAYHLAIDVLRAALALPARLDKLAKDKHD